MAVKHLGTSHTAANAITLASGHHRWPPITHKPVICDVVWSHRIIAFLLPRHATHVLQPLNASIFGPLTSTYRRWVSSTAESVGATIDKVQFGSLYAQAREKVVTQSAARKTLSDSGISVNPDPDKDLCPEASRMPLQEITIPRSDSGFSAALDATLNVDTQEPNSRDARDLKKIVEQTYQAAQACIAVLEAENTTLRAHQGRKSKTLATLGRMVEKRRSTGAFKRCHDHPESMQSENW